MEILKEGMIKRIFIDDLGENPICVKTSIGTFRSTDVRINGPSKIIHGEESLLRKSATWIETRAEVRIYD